MFKGDSQFSMQVLKAFIENSQESIFITDGVGTVIFVNSIAAKLMAIPEEILIGRTVQEIIDQGYYQGSSVLEAIKTKKTATTVIHPSEASELVSISTPILDSNDNVKFVITNSNNEKNLKYIMDVLEKEREKVERYKTEVEYLRRKDDKQIIAESDVMINVLNQANIVSKTDSIVAISGESGTGKDVVANLIHQKSKRGKNAFISINCAAIPENLLESEFFGYEKGSFTGASSKGKPGLFEVANHGTIFLDEIGELPITFQSKLLRVIENREIRRIGGTSNMKIDVRIICATNRDMRQMVLEKKFREDLYYRLSVFPINIPPLRKRKEDIIPLAEQFLNTLNANHNTKKYISPYMINDLLSYSWPGNIRELRNVIERAYIISAKDEIIIDIKIPNSNCLEQVEKLQEIKNSCSPFGRFDSLKDYLDSAAEAYISHVLEENQGNFTKAAKQLGVHRSALYRRINKYKQDLKETTASQQEDTSVS
ncbi:sigma-54 interaction domain-containing protein [Clostridium magnum]|uniref:Limonene hydroxylase n=1 Tax=Clostridium magnum DSM 2767 TaxID=1121326 RepID=A0A161WR74_9CLOT|nr:sigma 54-interacting transcriptional regulator [Clostridium magnum]KZL89218.1 limonene hydroxylase [Clostridium magnum DSM 2767]SHJ36598.1 PAS domain S-box-containing protein [Clostridium magnum DSM 2767]